MDGIANEDIIQHPRINRECVTAKYELIQQNVGFNPSQKPTEYVYQGKSSRICEFFCITTNVNKQPFALHLTC